MGAYLCHSSSCWACMAASCSCSRLNRQRSNRHLVRATRYTKAVIQIHVCTITNGQAQPLSPTQARAATNRTAWAQAARSTWLSTKHAPLALKATWRKRPLESHDGRVPNKEVAPWPVNQLQSVHCGLFWLRSSCSHHKCNRPTSKAVSIVLWPLRYVLART